MGIDFSQLEPDEFHSLVQWAKQGPEEFAQRRKDEQVWRRRDNNPAPNPLHYPYANENIRRALYEPEGSERARDDQAWRDKAIHDSLYGREGIERARDETAWQAKEPPKGVTASWLPNASTLDGSEEFRQRAIDDKAWREQQTQKAPLPERAEAIPTKSKKRRNVRDMDFEELLEAVQSGRRKRSRLAAMDEFFSRLSPEQMQMLISFAKGENVSFGPSVDETNALKKMGIGVKEVRTKDGRYVTAYQVRDQLFTDLDEAKAALQSNVLPTEQISALRQKYEQSSDLDDVTNPFQKEIKYGSD